MNKPTKKAKSVIITRTMDGNACRSTTEYQCPTCRVKFVTAIRSDVISFRCDCGQILKIENVKTVNNPSNNEEYLKKQYNKLKEMFGYAEDCLSIYTDGLYSVEYSNPKELYEALVDGGE